MIITALSFFMILLGHQDFYEVIGLLCRFLVYEQNFAKLKILISKFLPRKLTKDLDFEKVMQIFSQVFPKLQYKTLLGKLKKKSA